MSKEIKRRITKNRAFMVLPHPPNIGRFSDPTIISKKQLYATLR